MTCQPGQSLEEMLRIMMANHRQYQPWQWWRDLQHWFYGRIVVPVLRSLRWHPVSVDCTSMRDEDWRRWLTVFDARTGEDLQDEWIFRANRREGWYDHYVHDERGCPMVNPDNRDELLTERVHRPIRFAYSDKR